MPPMAATAASTRFLSGDDKSTGTTSAFSLIRSPKIPVLHHACQTAQQDPEHEGTSESALPIPPEAPVTKARFAVKSNMSGL